MKGRRFSPPLAFVFYLSLVFVSVLTKTGTAQTDTQNILFEGKKVGVQFVRNTQESGGKLEQVQVQKIGDCYFLVGKILDEGNFKDHMICVPLNSVTSIVELDSVEITRDASKASQTDTQSVLFKGKIAIVQFLRISKEHGSRLEPVQVQKIGDRSFLVGKLLDDDNLKGRMTWVPLDKVTSILEMDSVEKKRDAVKASQKQVSPLQLPH